VRTIFSTAEVHARDRFDYWHSVACESIVDHDSQPDCRRDFSATLQSGMLADIGLVVFENSPMAISHTLRHASGSNPDELFVCRQLAGRLALEQHGREVLLGPGDITLLDPRAPYAGRFFIGSRLLVLKVPRALLEARLGETREITARAVVPSAAVSRLTSAFLATLPAHVTGLDPTAEAMVENQVLDLVALTLATTQVQTRRVSSARSLVAMRLRAVIERRLTDPSLNAGFVAAGAGVSVRYANAVLADEGTSIGRLILARRLACCQRALEDPSQAHRTISAIAYGWGFSDMTHFGRKFRGAYGLLPKEYRGRAR
jgi:AraC-like DNA-binding protein